MFLKLTFSVRRHINRDDAERVTVERVDQLHFIARHLPDLHFRRVTSIADCARHDEVVVFSLLLGRRVWFLLRVVTFLLLVVVLLLFILSNMLSPSTSPANLFTLVSSCRMASSHLLPDGPLVGELFLVQNRELWVEESGLVDWYCKIINSPVLTIFSPESSSLPAFSRLTRRIRRKTKQETRITRKISSSSQFIFKRR